MPDTGAPWNIPYVAGTDLVADWPTDSQTLAEAIADGLDAATGVVQTVFGTTNTATNTTSATYVTTSLTATITPTSNTSDVVVLVQLDSQTNSSNGGGARTTIYRDATALDVTAYVHNDDANDLTVGQTLMIQDSPATTSATTYTVYILRTGGTGTASVEGRQNILLMEVNR